MPTPGRTSWRGRVGYDYRSTVQRVNQPEVLTEGFLGPMIKVPADDIALWIPRLSWSALAFRRPVSWLQLQHTTAFGSYLEWLTVDRWLGQGWRMDGFGSQSSNSLFLAKDPKVGVW